MAGAAVLRPGYTYSMAIARVRVLPFVLLALGLLLAPGSAAAGGPSWLRGAAVATPFDENLDGWTWELGVDRAVARGATVILDWARFSDEWECLDDPCLAADLAEMDRRVAYLHEHHPGVRLVVYISPLEFVTPGVDMDHNGVVDPTEEGRALSRQHPEWLQTGTDGRRALFFGAMPEMPFWVCADCEDVWLTPAHPGYRATVLAQVRRIAASGIDGLWLDVPFLNGEFGEGWSGQFPDLGPDGRGLFSIQTGRLLPAPPLDPDWSDPDWQAFVTWRHRLVREFVGAVTGAVHAIRPDFALVVESSVGLDPSLTQNAASPFEIPSVSDATAHEIAGVERAVQRSRWLLFLARLSEWRHLDLRRDEPSWLLGYVFSDEAHTAEVARLHAAATVAAGYGFHVSGNETMAGVPDAELRGRIFRWMTNHRGPLYPGGLRPLARTAVLVSQRTIDFRTRGSWELGDVSDGFDGMLMALLEEHVPFEVLGDDDLDQLGRFDTLVLPGVEAMAPIAAETIRRWVAGGGRLLATGLTSAFDGNGVPLDEFLLADLFGVSLHAVEEWDPRIFESTYGSGRVVFTAAPHERRYYWAGAPWLEAGGKETTMGEQRAAILDLLHRLGGTPVLETDAPTGVVFFPFLGRDGSLRLGMVNLHGTGPGDASPEPVSFSLRLRTPTPRPLTGAQWLEFLEQPIPLPLSRHDGIVELSLTVRTGGVLTLSTVPPPRHPAARQFPRHRPE